MQLIRLIRDTRKQFPFVEVMVNRGSLFRGGGGNPLETERNFDRGGIICFLETGKPRVIICRNQD